MLTYYLLVPFFYFFAYLPTSVLYGLSDIIAFFLRSVVSYRKEVTYTNLRNSFPQKSEKEINSIAKESYNHLADRVVENIRCLVISAKEINERVTIKNPEIFQELFEKKRSIILMVGHIGSWEFGGYKVSIDTPYKTFGIVSLISNPYFNKLIQRTRSKMGMQLIPMQDSKEFFKQPLTELSIGVFISDQSPSNKERAYWSTFLNQETAFFNGAERYAKLHNCVVVYPKIVQTKQGHFSAELIKIAEEPNKTAENEITEKFVRLLETHIQEHPSDWLWSHKRWKHKRAVN